MFHSLPPILLACLASACATAAVPKPDPLVPAELPPNGQASTAVTARPATALSDLQGEWDIVEFDGYRPPRLNTDGLRHAYVDVGASGMRFTIGCNYSGMAGSVSSDGVLVPAVPDTGMTTQMGCGPEREARDFAFFNFFRSRPQVELLSEGRLRIKGTRHSLLLERADIRRLAHGPTLTEITGTWRVVSITRFVNGGYQGWGAMFAPGRLRIDPSAITYSRCPALRVSFRYTADFTLSRQSPDISSGLCNAAKPEPTEAEMMLATLLAQSPHAERVPGGRYVLRSRDYAVLLAGEADYQRQFGQEAVEWERRPG
jgi:heat shock protein HslJ